MAKGGGGGGGWAYERSRIGAILFRSFLICALLIPASVRAGPYLKGIEITPPKGWYVVAQNGTTAPPEILDNFEIMHPGTKQLVQSGLFAVFIALDPNKPSDHVKKGSNVFLTYKRLAKSVEELEELTSSCPQLEKDRKAEGGIALECRMRTTSRHPYLSAVSRSAKGRTQYMATFAVSPELQTLQIVGTALEEPSGAFRPEWDAMLESISF